VKKKLNPVLVVQTAGHRPVYLKPGRTFSIGRNKVNNLVLADKTVSRFHATIRWNPGSFPRIVDNGSTAGIKVDKERGNRFYLRKSHWVHLGTVLIITEYHKHFEKGKPVQEGALLPDIDKSDSVTLFKENGSEDETGKLNTNEEIQKLLIHYESTNRTGTLKIETTKFSKCTGVVVVFAMGKIIQAKCSGKTDEESLAYILNICEGTYTFSVKCEVEESYMEISASCYLRSLQRAKTMRVRRSGETSTIYKRLGDLLSRPFSKK